MLQTVLVSDCHTVCCLSVLTEVSMFS